MKHKAWTIKSDTVRCLSQESWDENWEEVIFMPTAAEANRMKYKNYPFYVVCFMGESLTFTDEEQKEKFNDRKINKTEYQQKTSRRQTM